METSTIKEMPYRVLGQWSAQDADTAEQKQGQINYGFETQEKALAYIANLCSIAMSNDMYVRTEFARLDVSADKWSNMRNFQGSYRVAQYIN
jgi:hypothetical protein